MFDPNVEIIDENTANIYPYNCVGNVGFLTKLGYKGRGTGFLISKDLVMTAAHNIYSHRQKQRYRDIHFYLRGSREISQSYKVIEVRYPYEYEICLPKDQIQHDFAILKLDQNIVRSQYIKLGVDYIKRDETLWLIRCGDGDLDMFRKQIRWSNNHQEEGVQLRHQINTFVGGFGGSPLLVKIEGKFIAIGIHKGMRVGASYKSGRLITQDLVSSILTWQRQISSKSIKVRSLANNNQMINQGQNQQPLPINEAENINGYKEKIKQLQGVISQFQSSNVALREEKQAERAKYLKQKQKFESLHHIFQEFRGIKSLKLEDLFVKIDTINRKFIEYQIENNISKINEIEGEQSIISEFEGLNITHKFDDF